MCVCVGSVWDAIMYLIYCLMMFGIKDNLLGESMDACLSSLGVLWFIRLRIVCVVGSCEIGGETCVERGGGPSCWKWLFGRCWSLLSIVIHWGSSLAIMLVSHLLGIGLKWIR